MKRLIYLFLNGGLLLITCCCNSSASKKVNNAPITTEDTKPLPVELPKGEGLYVFKNTDVLDSTLFTNNEFSTFRKSIETIKELDPKELNFYLSTCVQETDKLLKASLHKTFEVSPVKSRLRIIKTDLLKCYYFSQENDITSLNSSLTDLFNSYNIFLMRIDDLAQDQKALRNNEFEVRKTNDSL